MAIGPEQQRLTPGERANLVAYLDGELNEAEARAISTKLTQSATARREVESLKRTWELLEYLERPQASEDFTARTLTEVQHLAVAGGQLESTVLRVAARVGRVALCVLATAAAVAIGFATTRWIWPSPTARLVRDLSIAEHLDEYRDATTFEYLEELANSPEFGSDRE